MNEPEPVDLSPLDPARDPERWSLLIATTRAKIDEILLERNRRLDPLAIMAGWARPVLTAAAAATLLLGAVLAELEGRRAAAMAAASDARRLAVLTEASVGRGRAPTGAELLAALRAGRAR
jgi:hypothetical protein